MQTQISAHTPRSATSNTMDCAAICLQSIQYCLEMGGAHADPSHVQLLQDCADICATTASFLLRGSSFQAHAASTCASVCDACAVSCEKFGGDAIMKACANQCLLCAAACEQVSSGAGMPSAAAGPSIGAHGPARPGQQRNK